MTDIKDVKGIGPKSLSLLKKLNIENIEDLVTYYPYRYDILKRCNLYEIEQDEAIVIDGRVESIPIIVKLKANLNKLNFKLVTHSGVVGVSIFNRLFLKKQLEIGTSVIVIGKFDKKKNIIVASDLKFGTLNNQVRIEPVYHITNGLTNKNISTFINTALLFNSKDIHDYIPNNLQNKYNFSNKKTALNIIHNPPSLDKLKEAKIRLKYEELFVFMFKIAMLKENRKKKENGITRNINIDDINSFIKTLPFELTSDQLKTVNDIVNDLNSSHKMNRLLQGDVGSGKTIVSFITMYANFLSSYQSALMAPTEILAIQHYNNIREIFKNTNIRIELLIGSMTLKEKKLIHKDLKEGNIDIVIGTHALIQEDVEYEKLGLVITDEQHRFGVNQRNSFSKKGILPDVLYMSATPIPRTYALTIYGDMDVSIIKEMPKGRLPVTTMVKKEDEISDVLMLMLDELQKKHQIYVIAPIIEENEGSNLNNIALLKNKMSIAFGAKYKIDVVHGKMARESKDLIMTEFKNNKIDILISTTVIEVGVDVSNASMIVIYDADRFGLSTLHQLRGRVGRGSIQSYCILVSDKDKERLKVMENTNDGFEISEEDFKLRGHGDLFGTKQSGDMTFKIANIKEDYKILVQAKNDSDDYLKSSMENDEIIQKIVEKAVFHI